jgi:hypothetical protein
VVAGVIRMRFKFAGHQPSDPHWLAGRLPVYAVNEDTVSLDPGDGRPMVGMLDALSREPPCYINADVSIREWTMDHEQLLVDLCFALVFHACDADAGIRDKTQEELAHWVADRLRINGFDISEPVSASWGLLKR